MKQFFSIITLLLLSFAFANGQAGVLDPNDPIVNYNSASPPASPTYNKMTKWVRTPRMNWDATRFKSYIYKGVQFRLMFPNSYAHNVVDGKKYPLQLFLHGLGEKGTAYDNEYQLLHGGQTFRDRVANGTYEGFLLYPQSTGGGFDNAHIILGELIDSLVKYVKVDQDRVVVHGLSLGGQGTWNILESLPKVFAGALPISGASLNNISGMPKYVHIPIKLFTGDKDNNPAPGTAQQVVQAFRDAGGNIVHTRYPTQGHGCWNTAWAEPSWNTFINSVHKANPLVYFERKEFCPGDPISVKLGLTPGFSAYEWEKNGVTISGATANTYTTTTLGTYRARFRRTATGAWSAWSPAPVVISEKGVTQSPPISIAGMNSNVLPAIDGSTTVPLTVTGDFTSYEWRRVSDDQVVSNEQVYNAPVGTYKVRITEQFGCSSLFSPNFTVVNANGGSGLPDAAGGLLAMPTSKTTIQIDWSDVPNPAYNETGFEIYRALQAAGPFTLINKVGANVQTATDQGLNPNTTYYYLVRAVNDQGASANSNIASGTTNVDDVAPEAPQSLVVTTTSRDAISLAWSPSFDEVGVAKYDVFVDGVKAYTTTDNFFTVNNLNPLQVYTFKVRARDVAGNLSPFSNQVTSQAAGSGLNYKVYNGTWTTLPNFATLTPVRTGKWPNVDIAVKNQNDNFGILWEGIIKIPVAGNYTFETCSDDGSKLYIGQYSHSATALVSNDGAHGSQCRTGTINLPAGTSPIAITYFQGGGGSSMQVYWTSSAAGISRQLIPNSAFDESTPFGGSAPAAPSNLNAVATAHNKVVLNWTDNSNNETNFEITRSTSASGPFAPVGSVGTGVTTYTDATGLSPNTRYFYKVRAIGQYGESAFVGTYDAAWWQVNNNATDKTGYGNTLTLVNGATYTTPGNEGTHTLLFDGTNDRVDIGGSNNFLKNGYDGLTASLWFKADLVSSSRILFDIGGSDDGLALRINANKLEVGIASNNTRRSLSIGFTSLGWNHAVVSYSKNALNFYLNGVLVASDLNLPFTSITSTTNASALGYYSGSTAFNSNPSTYFKGRIDDIRIVYGPVSAVESGRLMNGTYISADAVTQVLPAAPASPINLLATAVSSSVVSLTFTDNASNETSFDVYRSMTNNGNFKKIASVAGISGVGGPVNFNDSALFANVVYYYQVKAVGVGGESAFSNQDSALLWNDAPVIAALGNTSMKYGTSKTINLSATDPNNDQLTISVSALPAFASFNGTGNGTGQLVLNPALGDVGTYNFVVTATDLAGASTSTSFSVLVDANNPPVLNPVSLSTINEGQTQSVSISASDVDGNSGLVLSGSNLPPFITLTDNGNGSASLSLAPGYADADTYQFSILATDANGSVVSQACTLTVNEVNPNETIQVSIQKTIAAPAPWNNVTGLSASALKNTLGATTPVGLQFQTTAWNTYDGGTVTGNNSGVYPDAVLKDYYFFGIFGAPETVSVRTTGLALGKTYKFTFFAGSSWSGAADNGTTVFRIGGQSASVYVQNNTSNTAKIQNVVPAADGSVTFTMEKAAGTPVGYLNALVIESAYDDGQAPALAKYLAGQQLANGGVKLTWKDVAYNEASYEVYRSTDSLGSYVLLNPGQLNGNTEAYTDNTVVSSNTYFYKLRTVNANGSSAYTNIVRVTTGNRIPVITGGNRLNIKTQQSGTLNFTVSDDASDVLTVTATNLPAFATFQNTGSGTYQLVASPSASQMGTYNNINVSVKDDKGASANINVTISVTDQNVTSTYVKFGNESMPGAAPWNNFLGYPFGTKNIQGLKDENGVTSTVGITVMQNWTGVTDYGHISGDNSGIFEDLVATTGVYESTTSDRQLKITGLNPAKSYNIVLFGSAGVGYDASANVAAGGQSIVMQSRYNYENVFRLNALAPTAAGELMVTMTKLSGSNYMYLNALVIETNDQPSVVLAPTNLKANAVSKTSVKLSWTDRVDGESGVEIWRATVGGSFAKIATTAANVVSYVDNTAVKDKKYFYSVRAAKNAAFSAYSNVSTVITPAAIVYLNLNNQYPASAPWNNVNRIPQVGDRYGDLLNDVTKNTGFAVNLITPFNGEFWAGVVTGNNSGYYPDNVQQTNFWLDNGQVVKLKIDGLNQNWQYKLSFFASADWTYNSTSTYTANGVTRYLNAVSNKSRAEYISGIQPNGDGEIDFEVSTASYGQFGFLGALEIHAYNNIAGNAPALPGQVGGNESSAPIATLAPAVGSKDNVATIEEKVPVAISVAAQPNPFNNELQVRVKNSNKTASMMQVSLMNAEGVSLRAKSLNVAAGETQNVRLETMGLTSGIYILKVNSAKGEVVTSKLLKIE
ncbi:MAG TPA: fibronectin type III domain-containing protein [Phnomibacter sp.]|nr:fibronectin type III domain-containing protein [Phnomibacter sp.]